MNRRLLDLGRTLSLLCCLLSTSVRPLSAQTAADLARQLLSQDQVERANAAGRVELLPQAEVDDGLKIALITALEMEGKLRLRLLRGEIGRDQVPVPELIGGLAYIVSELKDARAIRALTSAMGVSPPSIWALADFGEAGAVSVLDVLDTSSQPTDLMAGLMVLRLVVENSSKHPITPPISARIRRTAIQKLTGKQESFIVISTALDLASALNDEGLKQILQQLTSDDNAIRALGVTDSRDVAEIKKQASGALRGIRLPLLRPRPRRQ